MRKFLLKLFFFFLPIISVLVFYEFLMWSLGETFPISHVFEMQENHNGLFMTKYFSQEFNLYKESGIKRYEPEILIVGSSRVMQFKGDFFEGDFYNAGGIIQNDKDLNEFLLDEIDADLTLLGIDPWWYKKDNILNATSWIGSSKSKKASFYSRYDPIKRIKDILLDFTSPRLPQNIGANAQLRNGGFRLDGSMKIPDQRISLLISEKTFIDTEDPPIPIRISRGLTERFSISNIDTSAFLQTVQQIKLLIDKGNDIIIYLPPFSNQSYSSFKKENLQKDFFQFTSETMANILARFNIKHIKVETPNQYNLDDTYFIDGIHPSEVFVAKQIEKHSSLFSKKVNLPKLKESLEERYCNLIFDSNEININFPK